MNTSTRLDSAVFQLTPTRTRFDLVITVNGKKEKIASGLLNPFLSHLKAAQCQMDKGGYSIVLEPPEGNSDTSWFTKGTVERFVRFVSTPEILERVYTIESEILQIQEAIAIQGNSSLGISTVEENQGKFVDIIEDKKTQQDTNEERAIVLYKPDAKPPQANESTTPEGSSKVHLLKVLETRKSALQKEQGMAFARAVAAGFDIDYIPPLMSFAECFGASRMKDACTKFRDLGRRKHETGQWLEIEAAEMMSNRSDFPPLNVSGIILPSMAHTEMDSLSNGKASSDMPPMDHQPSIGNQDNIQGQFPPQMFPPWPVHSPPGTVPVFQPYPVQGIPYYQAYPGNSPFMQPNYSPMEDPRLFGGQNNGLRRHSMESRHRNTELETQDEVDMEREDSHTGDRLKKNRRSSRQKSGMVVIRNINYITKSENSDSGSYSDSASETDTKECVKTSKRRESGKESLKKLDSSDREETKHEKDADGGHWQAFQSCLLRDVDEDRHDIDQDQFDMEKVNDTRRKKHIAGNDPLVFNKREMHEVQGSSAIDMHSISRGLTHMPKTSNDDLPLSARAGQSGDGWSGDDVQSLEVNGKKGGYRRADCDDFMISKQENQFGNAYTSSEIETSLGYSNNKLERKLFPDMNDDSYIVEHRSIEVNDAGNVERNAIDMDSEIPMAQQKETKSSDDINCISYEPDELSMLPERGAERGSMSNHPALDYEMLVQAGGTLQNKNKEVITDTKPGSKKLDKEPKSKLTPNNSDKRKTGGPIKRGKASKLNPLDEARARAESLRNYKADLQKMKKEKEEEEIKRLEALKMERQKRIAAKSKSSSITSQSPSQPTKKQLPIKPSPSSHKGSKFTDSELGASSPLQRFPVRTASVGSNDSSKASKTSSRLISRDHLDTNKLSRSVSSLPESNLEKNDSTTDTKASMARIRRLSEPKMSNSRQLTSVKPHGTGTISKTKAANGPESKKISAIVNHDKSKTAALPELKIKTSKASDVPQNISAVRDKKHKLKDNKPFVSSQSSMPKKNEIGSFNNDDGNPVVEKTVVMLEHDKPYSSPIHNSEENFGIPKKQYENDEVMEKTETASNYAAIHSPFSALNMDIIDKETSESLSHLQTISTEVKMDNTDNKPTELSSISIAGEMYQAPYARVSSMEDPSTRNSEYAKAAPPSFEATTETVKARVSNFGNSALEKIPEAIEKPQVKESSSKGFRRLLLFGKKSHSSAAERNTESDIVGIDGEADDIRTNGSSNEVHTLKNLISQDETPTASTTQQKSSRSFSLLSPFRSKNSEKKIMMA